MPRMVVVVVMGVGWAFARVVTMCVAGRAGYPVDMVRVVPVAMVPGCGTPIRHKAQSRKRRNGEYCCTCCGIAIDRATIRVAVNREAVDVVTGTGPGYAGVVTIRGIGEGSVSVSRGNYAR